MLFLDYANFDFDINKLYKYKLKEIKKYIQINILRKIIFDFSKF